MPKFIRKPVIVEANQYLGEESNDLLGVCCDLKCNFSAAHVHTVVGKRCLEKGEWVLPDPDGKHFYPVEDNLFRNAYEPLSECFPN